MEKTVINVSYRASEKIKEKSDRILAELHSEIRHLRDTEMRLLALFFQVAAFVIAGVALLFSGKLEFIVHLIVSAIYVVFISLFGWFIAKRLESDRKTYLWLGQRVTYIRKLIGVTELFPSESEFGSGSGYEKTQSKIAVAVFCIILLVIISDIWRFSNCDRSDMALAETLARNFDLKLAGPDALHFAMPTNHGAELVTFDARLAEAARALGAAVFMPV